MRAIGAAWGRTGTTSAAAALDILGLGPCVQMQTMWEQPRLAEAWAAHYRGRPADWRGLLAGFEASVDWPGAWECVFDRDRTMDAYRRHVESVRRDAPPERLIECRTVSARRDWSGLILHQPGARHVSGKR